MMPKKSVVEKIEEVLAQYQPGARFSHEGLEKLIRVNTPIWQGFKIRDLIRSLEARRAIGLDVQNPGHWVVWPDKVNPGKEAEK
jgi:hypothetical protein